jgi:surface polysaccharide O-acyltransferase-like enzyme
LTFVGAACFGFVGFSLRFGVARWPITDGIAENAFGIYFFHFPFVTWMQFAFLALPLPAIVKGISALLVSLLLSWLTSIAVRRMLVLTPHMELIPSDPAK